MMGTVVDLARRRPAKADNAAAPALVGAAPPVHSARRLCVGSAAFGFALAAAIETDAYFLTAILLAVGFSLLRTRR